MKARSVLPDDDVLAAYEYLYGELAANQCKTCKSWFMLTETGRRIKEDYHTFCSAACRARWESRQANERRKKRRQTRVSDR